MRSLIHAVSAVALVATPVVSFAQSNAPITHPQVWAELVELEQAGYWPSTGEDPNYPQDLQAALARVAAKQAATRAPDLQ
ncbi:protein of unknown function [Burkholderia sp. WP9]|uniref:DUF4148 domain-containing protein n=1 Tax=Burkholderia sp. WP9 TaxID=1500263 RepID=UPI0008946B70|nr:DUF4148 domain-containing protein [Burkholderia sp. WP9]SEF11548.1 protein of unknown function [Burkholderia sp. WP9]